MGRADSTGDNDISQLNVLTDKCESSDESLQASHDMCKYCFDILLKRILFASAATSDSELEILHRIVPDLLCPLFVTWDKKRRFVVNEIDEVNTGNERTESITYDLRGCIGSLSPCPLRTALGDYALASALQDRRFDPIVLNEVPLLRVAVSLLVQYEECQHVHDWEIGKHGIIIKFADRNTVYSATYLPEVAREQGWSQTTTVHSLVRKTGFQGTISEELLSIIKCTRYQSSKQKLTYDEYIAALGRDPVKEAMFTETYSSSPSRKWKNFFALR